LPPTLTQDQQRENGGAPDGNIWFTGSSMTNAVRRTTP
jgi:hypothetical protein